MNYLSPQQDAEALALAKRQFREHQLIVLLLLFAMWTVEMVQFWLETRFFMWGLNPRTAQGLVGIVTMPFLHSGFDHLMANSFGIAVLSMGLLHFYPKISLRVFLYSAIFSALLVWTFARPSYHIGASAVIYSFSAFIFISGVLRRDKKSVGAALVVAFLFGASVWGMLPFQIGISWEGHLFGAVTGSFLALRYRKIDLPPRYLEDEGDEENDGDEAHFREQFDHHHWEKND